MARLRATRLTAIAGAVRRLLLGESVYSMYVPASSAYSGPLLRVRRSNDNLERDFSVVASADGNGNKWLDTSAILDFVGGENLILWSEDYTNAIWTKSSASVGGKTVTSTSTASASGLTQTVNTGAGAIAFSVDILTSGTTSPHIRLAMNDNGTVYQSWANLSTGAVGTVQAGVTLTSTAITGGRRFTLSRTISATAPIFYIRMADFDNSVAAVVVGLTLVVDKTRVNRGTVAAPYQLTQGAAVSANSGYCSAWYDRSGRGRHLGQTTAASQPRIVNAGVLDTIGTRPTIVFDGVDDFLFREGAFMYAMGGATVSVVLQASAQTDKRIVSESSTVSTNPIYSIMQSHASTGTSSASFVREDGGAAPVQNTSALADPVFNNAPMILTHSDTGSEITGFRNGVSGTPLAYTRVGGLSVTRFAVGALSRATLASQYAGKISEIVAGPTLSTANRQAAEYSLATAYGIALG